MKALIARTALILGLTCMAVTALAPRPIALRLGRLFLFPEQRAGVNRLLRPLHRGHGDDEPLGRPRHRHIEQAPMFAGRIRPRCAAA